MTLLHGRENDNFPLTVLGEFVIITNLLTRNKNKFHTVYMVLKLCFLVGLTVVKNIYHELSISIFTKSESTLFLFYFLAEFLISLCDFPDEQKSIQTNHAFSYSTGNFYLLYDLIKK